MLKNYLTIAYRNLWRNKLYTALNVSGLAIGISACLVIYLIVSFELSFDTFVPDSDRIYRVTSQFSGAFEGKNSGVPAALPAHVANEYTRLEASAAFHLFFAQVSLPENGKKFEAQQDQIITQPEYFDVLGSYIWIEGSPATSLKAPFQVVLTESKAKTYFGNVSPQNIIGQTLHYNDSLHLTVSGIVKDLPKPTDFIFNEFISFSTINQSWLKKRINLEDWEGTNSGSQFFLKLTRGSTVHTFNAQLRKAENIYNQKSQANNMRVAYHLQPFSDFHFNAELGIYDFSRSAAHLPTLHILIGIALLLLLVAAINFINLVTAQAVKRAKEVGVRKVLGGTRPELIKQFLSETVLVTTLAVGISVIIGKLALSAFEEFIPKGVALQLTDPFTLAFLLLTIVVVSILSGLYPAFVLSSFAPALALKNQASAFTGKTRSAYLRKSLIIFQFSFAQVLIVGTFIMSQQIDFMLSKDMGFTRDAIINFSAPLNFWNMQKDAEKRFVLKQELSKISQISSISMHQQPPAFAGYSSTIFEFNNGKEIIKQNIYCKFGDTSYIHLYNIPLVAGRNLQPSDTVQEFLINETYARLLGFAQPGQAVGSTVKYNDKQLPIVGVVKDFHIQSLHKTIEPVAIASNTADFYDFSVKLSTAGKQVKDFKAVISQIEAIWNRLYPEDEFKYTFLDESIASFYEVEQRSAKLATTATGIAILISCLGLFGLAAYTAQTRTKEIGIRKVLGASLSSIITLLSKDFLWLVLIANVIAWPLAWWGATKWLEGFAYPVGVSPWIFAGSGLLALLIALLTVSYQSIKTALANPVKSLRNE